MLNNFYSHQWIITPEQDFDEEDFERFVLDEAFQETFRASLTRITRGMSQTLSKCLTAHGKAMYLWDMNLDLMTHSKGEHIFDRVLSTMKRQLETQGASVSTELTKVELKEDEVPK